MGTVASVGGIETLADNLTSWQVVQWVHLRQLEGTETLAENLTCLQVAQGVQLLQLLV